MRAKSRRVPAFEIPGLNRRQMVEFRTDSWVVVRDCLDLIAGERARIVSLSVRTVEGSYAVRSALEGICEDRIRALLSGLSVLDGISVETLFYSARPEISGMKGASGA